MPASSPLWRQGEPCCHAADVLLAPGPPLPSPRGQAAAHLLPHPLLLLLPFLPLFPDRERLTFPSPSSAVPTPSPSILRALEVPGTNRHRQRLRRIPFFLPTGRIEPGRPVADGRVLALFPASAAFCRPIPASPPLSSSRALPQQHPLVSCISPLALTPSPSTLGRHPLTPDAVRLGGHGRAKPSSRCCSCLPPLAHTRRPAPVHTHCLPRHPHARWRRQTVVVAGNSLGVPSLKLAFSVSSVTC